MRLHKAVMTGMAGLMLAGGLGTTASAQPNYRYRRVMERRHLNGAQWRTEQAVRQAYLDILRREPDPAGLEEYTDAMLRRGWSIADVRQSLATSDEYAQRFGRRGRWQYNNRYR